MVLCDDEIKEVLMNPRKYTVSEYYYALTKGTRSVTYLIRNKTKPVISPEFVERIMLSVTEVNGCAICAYGHTQMALKMGLSQEEITAFLSGNAEVIRPDEAKAILFAQHYAETKGFVDREAHQTMIDHYGESKSRVILAAIQMMMIGNIAGLPISAFNRRLKGHKDQGSHLITELGIPSLTVLLLLPTIIKGVFENFAKKPYVSYGKYEN
jgi:AhpD family alkylhydroperoxidase